VVAGTLPVPPSGEIGFEVLRNGSPIGEHHVIFTQNPDGDLLVNTSADLRVRVAGIQVYHYQMQVMERWSGGEFTSLDSHVNQNGTLLEVHAQQIAGGFAIQSTKHGNYNYTGPTPMMPLTYWNKSILQAMILNVETGGHYLGIVNSPGWNYLPTANDGTLLAQRFDITGKLHITLWYDQFNQWDGLEFNYLGDVTFRAGLPPRVTLAVFLFGMAQMPEPLMRRHKTLDASAAVGIGRHRAPGQHVFQNPQKLLGDFVIRLVTSVVECKQDFVRQPPAIARCC
jgi:hypothetical protein